MFFRLLASQVRLKKNSWRLPWATPFFVWRSNVRSTRKRPENHWDFFFFEIDASACTFKFRLLFFLPGPPSHLLLPAVLQRNKRRPRRLFWKFLKHDSGYFWPCSFTTVLWASLTDWQCLKSETSQCSQAWCSSDWGPKGSFSQRAEGLSVPGTRNTIHKGTPKGRPQKSHFARTTSQRDRVPKRNNLF